MSQHYTGISPSLIVNRNTGQCDINVKQIYTEVSNSVLKW